MGSREKNGCSPNEGAEPAEGSEMLTCRDEVQAIEGEKDQD